MNAKEEAEMNNAIHARDEKVRQIERSRIIQIIEETKKQRTLNQSKLDAAEVFGWNQSLESLKSKLQEKI